MKILHLVQKPQLRGAEMFASQLSTQFEKNGVDALMVFLYPGNSELPFEGKKVYLNRNQGKKFFDWGGWKEIARIIQQENPSLIQANAGDTLKYAVFSKLFFGWKQPIVFRNASTISLYIKGAMMKYINLFFFKKTDKIISVSQTSANDFKKLFPGQSKKVEVIPIGIETCSTENISDASSTNGKLEGSPAILHVGGFSFEKNHRGLLDIFSEYLKNHPEARLHLVGDGPLKIEVETSVENRGLHEKVFFYGFRKDPLYFMKRADVLVLPSIIEGLPGVILEAFYSKLSVVAYNVGGISEILQNGKTGYLAKERDASDFLLKLTEACFSSSENEILKENASELVRLEYLNERIAVKFLDSYKIILEKVSK